MKISKLVDHVVFPQSRIEIDKGSKVINSGETCLVLLENKRLLVSVFHNVMVDESTTLVISCGKDKSPQLQDNNINYSLVIAETVSDLLKILIGILKFTNQTILNLQNPLKSLIITNISVFYWKLQILNDHNYENLGFETYTPQLNLYHKLSILLRQITRKYRCSIIVLSYDATYDHGIFPPIDYYPKSDIQKYSKLPPPFLDSFTHICHKTRDGIKSFNKESNRWL